MIKYDIIQYYHESNVNIGQCGDWSNRFTSRTQMMVMIHWNNVHHKSWIDESDSGYAKGIYSHHQSRVFLQVIGTHLIDSQRSESLNILRDDAWIGWIQRFEVNRSFIQKNAGNSTPGFQIFMMKSYFMLLFLIWFTFHVWSTSWTRSSGIDFEGNIIAGTNGYLSSTLSPHFPRTSLQLLCEMRFLLWTLQNSDAAKAERRKYTLKMKWKM